MLGVSFPKSRHHEGRDEIKAKAMITMAIATPMTATARRAIGSPDAARVAAA